ncbi:pentapeptide repeat-containing protein [Nocardia sp. NPDC051832]|uniref:pentapeptide repeat-containing protein n=1 Tax=Nocardia sp. NPDC051832 TaxID=3155673 RepID=UPI00343B84E9
MSGRVSTAGAQARSRTTAMRARFSKDSRAALGRRAGRIRLFPAVTLALLAGLGVAAAAYGFLRWITPTDTSKPAAELDVTKVALTVVAGVGGVVALVIAYRRQRDLEQSRFVERFGTAAAQLGATDVAVRIAGVYAMAGVADESDGLRRQQCIDVLCGYLRLPYSPELGGNHQTKRVQKQPRWPDGGDNEDHFEYRQNDREVRATIVRVIADHLRPTAEYSWSTSNFDFRTAHLEDVDLTEATFSGDVLFGGATFSGDAWFGGTSFARAAQFEKTTFFGVAWFEGATFSEDAMFDGASFAGGGRFTLARFFSNAWFNSASFTAAARFEQAKFGDAALFNEVKFSGSTGFGGVTFIGEAWFVGTMFTEDTVFEGAAFSKQSRFDGASFFGDVGFDQATFIGAAQFEGVAFSGAALFARVDFGSEPISFAGPKQWGPPTPWFDWDQGISQKPANVEPQDWPPTAATPPSSAA